MKTEILNHQIEKQKKEYFDLIIIGAGIAGCSLAYNLKKRGYKGKILILDKKEIGANAAYGYRNTTKETINEYKIPYKKKFKGIKIGIEDQTYFKYHKDFYFINYAETCKKLLEKSNAIFKKERALTAKRNSLKTEEKEYSFRYLVDASGNNFFLNKILKRPSPSRTWIGLTRVLKNTLKKDQDYFYHHFTNKGTFEDLYPLKNFSLQGEWQYSKDSNFNNFNPHKKTILNCKFKNPKVLKKSFATITCSPTLPLSYKNLALIGDSFGNSTTSSALGIDAILDTSKILSNSIIKNKLDNYTKIWKKKYMKTYNKHLILKLDTYLNGNLLNSIKRYPLRSDTLKRMTKSPQFFDKIFLCTDDFEFPPHIANHFPKRRIIWLAYYFILLNLRNFYQEKIKPISYSI